MQSRLFILLFTLWISISGNQSYAEPPQRFIIGFKRSESGQVQSMTDTAKTLQSALRVEGYEPVKVIPAGRLVVIDATEPEAKALMQSRNDIAFIEPDYETHLFVEPNDPEFTLNYQWGLKNLPGIKAPEAWNITTGASSVVVGVLDSGIDYFHPDLQNNIWVNTREIQGNNFDDDGNGYADDIIGYNFRYQHNNPLDYNGHGTHVSGTIAAQGNNSYGVTGVSWASKILPLQISDSSGAVLTSAVVEAIYYAIALKNRGVPIAVLNMSFGGGNLSTSEYNACAEAGSAGIVIVAAAGNGGFDGVGDSNDMLPFYPSNFALTLANVVSVASINSSGQISSFSNYGSSVHIAAPGEGILSTYPSYFSNDPYYKYLDGTSMAAPHVAGAVALMASVKTLAASKVVQLLRSSANPLPSLQGLIYTGATLDAYAAVIAARDFIQTYSIVGTVISSGLPLSGVTLTLSEASATATTSAQGTFTFPSIADGTTVTIVPSLVGYSFSPAYRTGRISQNSQADFTAILVPPVPPVQPVQPTPIPLREVKGTVSAKGKKVSGSTVTLKAKSGTYQTKTKSKNGKFTFIGISEGTYQLSIQDKKHKFKPRTFDILVVGGNTSKSFKAK